MRDRMTEQSERSCEAIDGASCSLAMWSALLARWGCPGHGAESVSRRWVAVGVRGIYGGIMAERSSTGSQTGTQERSTGGATAPSPDAGATGKVDDNGQRKNVSALAGFRLPWPQGLEVNPTRMLWWGGLAALAAIEIIEWPVALVVGAGSVVAERLARQDAAQSPTQHT